MHLCVCIMHRSEKCVKYNRKTYHVYSLPGLLRTVRNDQDPEIRHVVFHSYHAVHTRTLITGVFNEAFY